MKKPVLIIVAAISALCVYAQTKGVSPVAGNAATVATGTTWAVVVGISDYQDKDIPDLRFADRDAEAFAEFLRSNSGGKLDMDHLKVLINKEATMARFANQLDWLLEQARENDRVIIYFSGHGDVEKKTLTQPGFLLCWDSPPNVYIAGGAIALPIFQEVISTLSILNKAKVIVITDACRSGKLAGSGIGGAQATAANMARQFANEIKVLSCQPNELSLEGEQWGGGRGAFSYHLVNALYGLADSNGDQQVSLLELGRYLEDHVSREVAPLNQLPMVLGNRTEQVSQVDQGILSELLAGNIYPKNLLTKVEMRGKEDAVLTAADSTIRKTYGFFQDALQKRNFFEPASACAEFYYQQLLASPQLVPLQSLITRNYAASLQEDAQQAVNFWLSADIRMFECIGRKFYIDAIPRQLERASQLLGPDHYLHKTLESLRLVLEGQILFGRVNQNKNVREQLIPLFQKAADASPDSPLPWYQLCMVYASKLRIPDSAYLYAVEARKRAPRWVLPFVNIVSLFPSHEISRKILVELNEVDSLHPYVINSRAIWNRVNGNPAQALEMMERYKHAGGFIYPCWLHEYGQILTTLGRRDEAEIQYKKSIEMDSSMLNSMGNLGNLYYESGRYEDAAKIYEYLLPLDSMNHILWDNLGKIYATYGRNAEAEYYLKKAILLDSTFATHWYNLGAIYLMWQRIPEAISCLEKAAELKSDDAIVLHALGKAYSDAKRYQEAEQVLLRGLKLDAENETILNGLGYVYLSTGKYADAEKILKRAIALKPYFPNPLKHLGMVCFKTNRFDEARQYFLKALELNPDYAGAMLGMAYLLFSEGKAEEAIRYVEQAIGKGSNFKQLNEDEDLAPLRSAQAWMDLMQKHFPEKMK